MTPSIKLNKTEALDALWRKGVLIWQLDSVQKELYDLFYKSNFKVQTWLLARRSGKSFTLVVLAIEQCLRKPNSIVKFVSPTKIQVDNNLRPILRKILETCPQDIKPEFRSKDYIYYFPNGSEIQLSGTESGHAEKLRGGDADICIVDEAGSCKDLDNVVKSILLPTTLITKGKVILASTPPKETEHDFLDFIEEAELRGSLVRKTVYDNPRITKEQLQELIDELGGITTEAARRELLCETVKDSTTSVMPEFNTELEREIVKDWPRPPFYDSYEAMDLGGRDLTVVLFGYYDFRADKVIVEDELVLDFSQPNVNIQRLTQEIETKENTHFLNPLTNEVKTPYARVSDIDYIVINEISKYSNKKINFKPTNKDQKDAAINNVRVMLQNKKIIINPRCKTLIRHLKNVKWKDSNKQTFARSPENGHYDAVDALIYLIRNISYSKNPYPKNYGLNLRRDDIFVANPKSYYKDIDPMDVYRQIFGKKQVGKVNGRH